LLIFLQPTFKPNMMISLTQQAYGVVTIDTSKPAVSGDGAHNVLTVRATAGGSSTFENNAVNGNSGGYYNSLYFGPVNDGTSLTPATLVIDAQAGGEVNLLDPILVRQNNDQTFTMNVVSSGDFNWGGDNRVTVDAANPANAINLRSGSRTSLVIGSDGDSFNLTAYNLAVNLENDALLRLMRHNSRMNVAQANLSGRMYFNVNDGIVNNPDPVNSVLLNLITPPAPRRTSAAAG
jgi:hypothetical protein